MIRIFKSCVYMWYGVLRQLALIWGRCVRRYLERSNLVKPRASLRDLATLSGARSWSLRSLYHAMRCAGARRRERGWERSLPGQKTPGCSALHCVSNAIIIQTGTPSQFWWSHSVTLGIHKILCQSYGFNCVEIMVCQNTTCGIIPLIESVKLPVAKTYK
jgi:hypothetical protein